ncbi:MAG TPA: peptide deformylase [Candidatus Hydrogenedentes bacterium]|nr:peptide deformylase [Candidatus Hydrogenedentota bacterium]HOV76363.1 peptide deformylase [Candidatus Hydrogenedentota bacterium]HRT22408.1 peptide deformylase [Candidatus Hydrogenedentota bacterium]HRT67091.1 peptide deformylase [Candidatus Hydrogenedentota bacterium]
MATREILLYPDERLARKAAPVSEFGSKLRRLAEEMLETMEEFDGVGLAAPQIGESLRLFVLREPEKNIEMCLVNPEFDEGDGYETAEEGCLSVPQIYAPVRRFKRIRVRAQDVRGKPLDFHAEDLLARIIQHETDHLDGFVFLDRVDVMTRVAKTEEWEHLREQILSGAVAR